VPRSMTRAMASMVVFLNTPRAPEPCGGEAMER
jgi:hypothetical protein